MKRVKTMLTIAAFATVIYSQQSCGNKKSKNNASTEQTEQTEHSEHHEHSEKQGKEYTAEYVCPMQCEGSGSDQEGECPKCGMAYVKNENPKTDGHTH
ncbi:MAG: heavy metal-binding domain-containing protein [Flavobacteriaceae bacterium]